MLNYEIDPDVLTRLVPRQTELDTCNGKTYVSLVGFRFLRTRVMGLPIPFHRNFDEVNLRFYVRRDGPEGTRRGVVFVKEIVPRTMIAGIARLVYNENYVALPMRHAIDTEPGEPRVSARYEWKHAGRWNHLSAEGIGAAYIPDEDSEEEFVTEHYWGYTRQRNGSTAEYPVEHPRWTIRRAAKAGIDVDVASLYGEGFATYVKAHPVSAFIADGSEVVVRRGVKLK
jgi:uncharacterized protein YqjF (DUF2071 family)